MEVVNLLDFLNNQKSISTQEYSECDSELINFLDLLSEDEQFTQSINLGVLYVNL